MNIKNGSFLYKEKTEFQTKSTPVSMVGRFNMWVCGRSLDGIAGANPAGGMNVCYECCVLSGRGLCIGLITLRDESYRVWCVVSLIANPRYCVDLGTLEGGRGGGDVAPW